MKHYFPCFFLIQILEIIFFFLVENFLKEIKVTKILNYFK